MNDIHKVMWDETHTTLHKRQLCSPAGNIFNWIINATKFKNWSVSKVNFRHKSQELLPTHKTKDDSGVIIIYHDANHLPNNKILITGPPESSCFYI